MTTYEMTGRPLGAPAGVDSTLLADHSIGDVFDASLDKDAEQLLIGHGAIRRSVGGSAIKPKPAKEDADASSASKARKAR